MQKLPKIKMINIDIDGTLLTSKGTIPDGTFNLFKRCAEKGIYVVITSGRPLKSTKTISQEAGASKYVIVGNGAGVYDITDETCVANSFLTQQKALDIIEVLEQNSITYNVYTETEIVAKELKYNILFYQKENLNKPVKEKTNITLVDNIPEYLKRNDIQWILKITVCDDSKVVFNNITNKVLSKIDGIEILDVAYMSRKLVKVGSETKELKYFFTEISRAGANKWGAICKLAKHLGIKEDEILTIGDNVNDLTMIGNAKYGIAMDNASDKVKAVATDITDDNDHDGVIKAIEKYVFGKE